MKRAAEITTVLSKHGLDWLSHGHSPWRFLSWPRRITHRPEDVSQAEDLRLALEELGTTFIKLGQAVSTRTDLVPPEYVVELSKLQDDAPPVPFEDIQQVIYEELCMTPVELFRWFDPNPLAAASIGQVHRAVLLDGTPVVVKVQRPNAEAQVEEDLLVLGDLVKVVSASPKLAQYDFQGLLDEFKMTILSELDYRREGRNADKFRTNFLGDERLHVPIVHWEYTTRRVLTMQECSGIKITDLAALDAAGINRQVLAHEAVRVVLTQIFEHGFFHADPHAGNFFVEEDGSIDLLDYGMVGRLDQQQRDSLMRLTLGMSRQDTETVIDELLFLGVERRVINRQALKVDLSRLIQQHMEAPPEEFSLANLVQSSLAMAAQHGIGIPSDLLFLARALAMCEGLGNTLDPGYRMVDTTRAHLEAIYRKQRSPEALMERTRENYVEIGDLALDFPRRLRRVLGQVERGDLTVTARLGDVGEIMEHIHRAANRLSMSVLIAGVIAGLSVLSLRLRPDQQTWNLWINLMLFIVIAGAVMLLASIWKSRKA